MSSHDRVAYWSTKLGLLPIPLRADSDRAKVIMMNGTFGNFCLGGEKNPDLNILRAYAWSSNVGHFVSVYGSTVSVLRYDASARAVERYSLRSVEDDLERFHSYLEKAQPRESSSVISHSVRIFRQLRSICGVSDGQTPLSIFLLLLAQVADRAAGIPFDTKNWMLPDGSMDAYLAVDEPDREMLFEEFLAGRTSENLTFSPQLLLRHAAGQLFQEAHYEASIAQQMRFAGFSAPSAHVKNSHSSIGVHFTPPSLARTLVEQALRISDLRSPRLVIFDPACGSGEFLRESIRQLRSLAYEGEISVIGWDISSTACDMARFILAWESRADKHGITFDVQCQDSLVATWPDAVDILLMNPPFLSYEFIHDQQRDDIRRQMGRLAKGRFDLSTAFVWKAVRSVREGCVIGAITPSSFLESNAAEDVRKDLGQSFDLRLVARLGNQTLFSNALVDAAVFVGTTGKQPDHSTIAFWADYRSKSLLK